MNRSIRILTCAGALLSLLTFSVPAHAAGWAYSASGDGLHQAAWEWITGVWSPGRLVQDHGPGIDPDGLNKSDRSSGIDPDGKPNGAITSVCTVHCDPNG